MGARWAAGLNPAFADWKDWGFSAKNGKRAGGLENPVKSGENGDWSPVFELAGRLSAWMPRKSAQGFWD
jgi:hypothetical protein